MRIRRVLILFLSILLLMVSVALAAEQPVYIQYGDTGRPIGWLQAYLGMREMEVYNSNSMPCFADATLSALENLQKNYGLSQNCVFDRETLYFLLSPADTTLDGYADPLVWIPMYGGERYHSSEACSGMIEPRQMPVSCAEALGFTPCGKCY